MAADTPAYSRAGTIVYSVLGGAVGAGLLALIVFVTRRMAHERKGKQEGQ